MTAWDYKSGITSCARCDGTGWLADLRHPHPNDPDNASEPCPDCAGEGHLPCPVCGWSTPTAGYDCFVCDTARELANNTDVPSFGAAIACAISARKAAQ